MERFLPLRFEPTTRFLCAWLSSVAWSRIASVTSCVTAALAALIGHCQLRSRPFRAALLRGVHCTGNRVARRRRVWIIDCRRQCSVLNAHARCIRARCVRCPMDSGFRCGNRVQPPVVEARWTRQSGRDPFPTVQVLVVCVRIVASMASDDHESNRLPVFKASADVCCSCPEVLANPQSRWHHQQQQRAELSRQPSVLCAYRQNDCSTTRSVQHQSGERCRCLTPFSSAASLSRCLEHLALRKRSCQRHSNSRILVRHVHTSHH